MTRSRGRERQINNGSAGKSENSEENSNREDNRPERSQREPRAHRLRVRMVTANKAVLAAVGTGVLGAITAGVLALPHLAATLMHHSPPPLTVAGGTKSQNIG